MADTHETCCVEARGLERVRYFPRMLLTADDMLAEQQYARERQRRFNRFMVGWGVVCGMDVAKDPAQPLAGVDIHPGYALGPWGDEIYVHEKVWVPFDRRLANPVSPCKPSTAAPPDGTIIYVAIRYHECLTRPVRTSPTGCGCDDTACEYSRVRDGHQVEFLNAVPRSHDPVAGALTLCELHKHPAVVPCPPCPADPWLVLATLKFERGTASEFKIDVRTNRRILYSAALVQAETITHCP